MSWPFRDLPRPAIPLIWQTLEHPCASVSAEVVIALLERAFLSAELLGWFQGRSRWRYVMRLRSDNWIHGTAVPMSCEVRRPRLLRGHCRGFRDVRLWDGNRQANLLLARPIGIKAADPWYLVSNLEPSLDLVWAYGQRFCCEQLFRDQKSGIFQLGPGPPKSNCMAYS